MRNTAEVALTLKELRAVFDVLDDALRVASIWASRDGVSRDLFAGVDNAERDRGKEAFKRAYAKLRRAEVALA